MIQFVGVPVFLHFWGPKLYGEWLVLSAIPIYLGLTDFGFGSVAANEMTMKVARGERTAALEVFQSAWTLTTAVSAFFGLCVVMGLWAIPIERWLNLTVLSKGETRAILCILCASVLLDLQWTLVAAGFRSDGNYALGTLLGVAVTFATNASSIIVVAFHASPLIVAIVFLGVRLLGNLVCQVILERKSPWLHYGYRYSRFSIIRKLFGPAIAYMALAVSSSFSFQGMTIVVSVVLGPIAVVMFSTVRTLTRFAYQMVDMITNSVWAELSVAFGAGDKLLARNLHRCACQASLGLSTSAALLLALFGNAIYVRWTHYKIAMDHRLFYLLLVEVLASSFWVTSSIVSIACNRHERQAVIYLAATALSLPAAYFLIPVFGLAGAGIGLLMVDLCMIAYVLPHSLALLGDTPAEFFSALFRAPSLQAGKAEVAG